MAGGRAERTGRRRRSFCRDGKKGGPEVARSASHRGGTAVHDANWDTSFLTILLHNDCAAVLEQEYRTGDGTNEAVLRSAAGLRFRFLFICLPCHSNIETGLGAYNCKNMRNPVLF